ncbi:MAG: ribbon-helix-helix protein, CopG family [Candidatus Binataceae bacterium]
MPATAVKRTISLPKQMAREAERIARTEGRSLSAVIQEALRIARTERLKREFGGIQNYWSRIAREKGILTERDLKRYLRD